MNLGQFQEFFALSDVPPFAVMVKAVEDIHMTDEQVMMGGISAGES